MSNIFRHNKYVVYQDALSLSRKVRVFSQKLPKSEIYSLRSQITRACDSVVLNIAEGVDRYTSKDFGRFLNQAISSLSETVACLDICVQNSYIVEAEYKTLVKEAEILYMKLNSLHSKVTKSNN
jgi:four helix bundle protein